MLELVLTLHFSKCSFISISIFPQNNCCLRLCTTCITYVISNILKNKWNNYYLYFWEDVNNLFKTFQLLCGAQTWTCICLTSKPVIWVSWPSCMYRKDNFFWWGEGSFGLCLHNIYTFYLFKLYIIVSYYKPIMGAHLTFFPLIIHKYFQ